MGRFAAIALVNLRVELAEISLSEGVVSPVLAVVIARPGGTVKDEVSLLGNTRLDEVSLEAYRCGIRPGHTVASARARCADLRVRVVPLESVEKTLAGVAEIALAFGPTTSFKMGGFAGDVVWVDVTGCAHLHQLQPVSSRRGAEAQGGEHELLSKLRAKIQSLGHSCRVAVADGPHVAAAVARFGGSELTIVPPGGNVESLARLPLAALGIDKKTSAWMSALGLRRVGDLQRLPRASLAARINCKDSTSRRGQQGGAARIMALLEGDDRAPLVAYVPPELPSEEAILDEYGIESAEALLFVAKRLASRLSLRLEGRCQKAARLKLALHLDRGAVPKLEQAWITPRHSRGRAVLLNEPRLEVTLASPVARENEIFAVLKTKIEALDRLEGRTSGPFRAPIVRVLLRATEVVTARAEALDLPTSQLDRSKEGERALSKLANELMAELETEQVGMLALADAWGLEERSRLLPYGLKRGKPPSGAAPFLSGGAEPTRLLVQPKGVKRSSLLYSRLVARFEAVEWWRRGQGRVEHYVSWVEDKRAMAWVELDGEKATVKGFVD